MEIIIICDKCKNEKIITEKNKFFEDYKKAVESGNLYVCEKEKCYNIIKPIIKE